MLLTTLQQIHHAINEDRLLRKCAMALLPTIDSYKRSIEEMETTLSKLCQHKIIERQKLQSHQIVAFRTREKSNESR
jgi:hypothetical protein